jgi:hypothetical protein
MLVKARKVRDGYVLNVANQTDSSNYLTGIWKENNRCGSISKKAN